MIATEKQRLREHMRSVLRDVSASGHLSKVLETWPVWTGASNICVFAPLRSEPDPLTPWPHGKQVGAPAFRDSKPVVCRVTSIGDFVAGPLGAPEPGEHCEPFDAEFDLILLPGLAFDPSGARLGRGGGFYDRLLRDIRGRRAGICHESQIVEHVPTEPHDQRVDFIVTPQRVVACGSRRRD